MPLIFRPEWYAVTSSVLILIGKYVSDSGLLAFAKALKHNKMLTSLNLSSMLFLLCAGDFFTCHAGCNIGDNKIHSFVEKALQYNQTLTSLNLASMRCNVMWLSHVIPGNGLYDESVIAIAKWLKTNNALTSLNLYGTI